ncbi:MAG: LemA family protein [Acidovorax sp.]|nr:LemA family protein [Acidovorax sp.]MCI5068536.1 LemA family protein [Acidovorax sp.]
MWSSPLFWIAVAVAVFWALGAYNRLMRLRSAVIQAFGSFDAHMVRLLALVSEYGAVHAAVPASSGPVPALAALEGAATQLSASLAMARARPLQPDAAAALAAARDVLYATWDKTTAALAPCSIQQLPQQDGSEATESLDPPHSEPETLAAAAPLPPSHWQMQWESHLQQNTQAADVFNDAVLHYNAAIAQFPANLLARVFGFKAARGLQ